MRLQLVTAPIVEPVSLAELKLHSRLDLADATEDALLTRLITAARLHVETLTGRALCTQTWRYSLKEWPASLRLVLPRPPLQSVTSVTYLDADGVTQTMSAGDYRVYGAETAPVKTAYGPPGEVWLRSAKSWPTASLEQGPAITVEYVAGYGGASDVPTALIQAVLLLAGHWYEHREAAEDSKFAAGVAEMPFAVKALLAPLQVWT